MTRTGVRKELIKRRTANETHLRHRFERARKEGDLSADANAANLARYIATLSHGIAVQAASGATRDELRQVAEVALRAWQQST